jgi:raffinose/stachyose/melibiose transport system substrate-binding protein
VKDTHLSKKIKILPRSDAVKAYLYIKVNYQFNCIKQITQNKNEEGKAIMKDTRLLIFVLAIILIGLFTACKKRDNSFPPNTKSKRLKVWHYEAQSGAMAIAWAAAIKKFEETHPEVEINLQYKSFEQVRRNALMVLKSDQAPDIMEYNKGNATTGLLVRQGLLTDLTEIVKQKGWDKLLNPNIQTTCRYNSNGTMGQGQWYGVTNYGEYVLVYYNEEMVSKEAIIFPSSIEEFELALEIFKRKGITPIALGGAEYPAQHIFYELVLQNANRAFIDAFQFFKTDINFKGAEMMYAAKKIKEWVDKGYIDKDAINLKAEDMGLKFKNGESPFMITGSWWYSRLMKEIKDFKWGVFLFPGNNFHPGSGGNLWVVPTKSKNKQLAFEFINVTMQSEIQSILGKEGGIPVNADLSQDVDPQIMKLVSNFNEISTMDGLAFYPDWPVPGYYDALVADLQKLMYGTQTPDQFLDSIGKAYFKNRLQY